MKNTFIIMTFLIKYFSYPDIHNRPILENGCVPFPNHYLHFGDFDLAGINIFLFEFQQYLGKERSSYLIPADIESRLKFGSRKGMMNSVTVLRISSQIYLELQQLIDLIHHERKAYDQEGYICCEP